MSEIKRYLVTLVEGDTGALVHYDDHQAALAKAVADERERCKDKVWAFFGEWRVSGSKYLSQARDELIRALAESDHGENNDGC